eukprot:Polyplicarium_translucidae@DN5297_c0_g1_i1.p1
MNGRRFASDASAVQRRGVDRPKHETRAISFSLRPSQPQVPRHLAGDVESIVCSEEVAMYEEAITGRSASRRASIFKAEALDTWRQQYGEVSVERAVFSIPGYAVQAVIFVSMVFMLGLTPIVKQKALWNEASGQKELLFISQSPYVVHFGTSVVLGNLGAFATEGLGGLADCWDVKALLLLFPVSALYALGESTEMQVLAHLDGTTWKILNQLKLPFTAFAGFCLFNRRPKAIQWVLIGVLTATICGYSMASSRSVDLSPDVFGMTIGVMNVIVSTSAGVLADVMYKKLRFSFIIQIAQGRLIGCLLTIAMMVTVMWKRDELGSIPFFAHWNWRVVILVGWLLMKDWLVTFVLKNMDALWKAIGTALGLCVTYSAELMFMERRFDAVLFAFVIIVVLTTVAFTMARPPTATTVDEPDIDPEAALNSAELEALLVAPPAVGEVEDDAHTAEAQKSQLDAWERLHCAESRNAAVDCRRAIRLNVVQKCRGDPVATAVPDPVSFVAKAR